MTDWKFGLNLLQIHTLPARQPGHLGLTFHTNQCFSWTFPAALHFWTSWPALDKGGAAATIVSSTGPSLRKSLKRRHRMDQSGDLYLSPQRKSAIIRQLYTGYIGYIHDGWPDSLLNSHHIVRELPSLLSCWLIGNALEIPISACIL